MTGKPASQHLSLIRLSPLASSGSFSIKRSAGMAALARAGLAISSSLIVVSPLRNTTPSQPAPSNSASSGTPSILRARSTRCCFSCSVRNALKEVCMATACSSSCLYADENSSLLTLADNFLAVCRR